MDGKTFENKRTAFHKMLKSSVIRQQRKTNFTQRELNILLSSVANRRRTILSGASAGQDRWMAAWREVAHEVSAVEGIGRTDADVRKKWTYLKWEAKNTSKPYRDVTSRAVLNILTKGNYQEQDIRSSSLSVDVLNAPKQQLTSLPSTSGVVPSHPPAKPSVPVRPDVRPNPPPHPPVVKTSPSAPEPSPLPLSEEESSISVRWNTYATNMSAVMPSLLEDEKFVDVTLACDGKYIKCHKVILGACSAYFEELLSVNPCQHPIILMKDFQFWELQAIVEFMYRGVVNIPQHQLPKLLQVASVLQIKGLTGGKNDNGTKPDETTTDEHSRTSQRERNSKSRKRTESLPVTPKKSSKVPIKRLKSTVKRSTKPLDLNTSDDSSNHSDSHSASQSSTPSVSQNPSDMLHLVCVKEESPDYGGDDSSYCSYRYDQNVSESGSSQPGEIQLLMLPDSASIKQEESEEMLDPSDGDPLELQSGMS